MQHVIEAQAVAVAEDVRGDRLGHRLLRQAVSHYQRHGYRIMLGTLLLKNRDLVSYYRDAGCTVLAPGEALHLVDPLGVVLSRPASSHVIQMWMPLHPDVKATSVLGPHGGTVPAVTGALSPPAHAPKVIRHADGSATFEGDGRRKTLPAQVVRLLESVRAQPVTEAEIRAAAPDAARYGIEPVIAAQLRKSAAALRALQSTMADRG